MSTTLSVDAARVELLRTEPRLSASKLRNPVPR